MATYYVWSGAGGTNTGGSWTNAFTAFGSAVTAATTDGDIIKVHKTHQENFGAATTYTFGAHVSVICVDKDASDALATMGTGGWIGNSTTSYNLTIAGAYRVYFYGITLRNAGASGVAITLAGSDLMQTVYESCYFWIGSSGSGAYLATNAGDQQVDVLLKNCTIRFARTSTGQSVRAGGRLTIEGGGISADGTAYGPFIVALLADPASGYVHINGFDLSPYGSETLIAVPTTTTLDITLANCKLGSGAVILTAGGVNLSQTNVNLFNCSSGDNHYEFGHFNYLGSTVAVTTPYVSDGALYDGTNNVTWKIVTTSAATIYTPYVSPWIETYHTGTSAITPSLEGLMIDDSTVATDAEVWGEFSYQGTTGFTLATIVSDRQTLLGSPANQTSSKTYSNWTASPATDTGDSTFKLATTATITPAEIGFLRARVCVGEASKTLYIDPKIRT